MLGSLDAVVAHFTFDDTRVGPEAAGGQDLEEQLAMRFDTGVIEGLRGKNPGATPWSGAPPGVIG